MEPYPKAYLYKRIAQAKVFMDDHFTEAIDDDLISGEAAFSKSHFIRLFKEAYGSAPRAYLADLRIERARQLMNDGMAVSDACYAVGFRSLPTFSRRFKERTGTSPSSYRTQCIERTRHMQEKPLEHIPTCYAHWIGLAAMQQRTDEMSDPG